MGGLGNGSHLKQGAQLQNGEMALRVVTAFSHVLGVPGSSVPAVLGARCSQQGAGLLLTAVLCWQAPVSQSRDGPPALSVPAALRQVWHRGDGALQTSALLATKPRFKGLPLLSVTVLNPSLGD